jgi:hypothetical protein
MDLYDTDVAELNETWADTALGATAFLAGALVPLILAWRWARRWL